MTSNMDEFFEDLLENVETASDDFKGSSGDDKLQAAKVYDMQARALMDYYKQTDNVDIERERLSLERYKIDEELKIRREVEEIKAKFEKTRANAEMYTLWARVGISALELGSGIAMGVLYLKANMKYGGMIGKDAKKWFDDLKRVRL